MRFHTYFVILISILMLMAYGLLIVMVVTESHIEYQISEMESTLSAIADQSNQLIASWQSILESEPYSDGGRWPVAPATSSQDT